MAIKIDHGIAKAVLYEEHQKTTSGTTDSLTEEWKQRVDRLGELCPYRKSSTFVAALGTAILAKTVKPNVDVYSLLDRDGGERSYSARSLADNVWAKNRAYLQIDLGANNANPLNNTPFVGRARIDAIENVRNKEGQEFFYESLDQLEALSDTDSAKAALRGFIASRIVTSSTAFNVGDKAGDHLVIQSLSKAIEEFVNTDSEDGRRAQAATAGLLSIAFGTENVEVGHVNDPDRHLPLDITVYNDPTSKDVRFSVEVKDKKIGGSDILSSVEKVIPFNIPNVLYIAIGRNQAEREFEIESKMARDLGCKVVFFFTWVELCNMCFSVTTVDGPSALGESYRQIGTKLVELGVSQEGVNQWAQWEHEQT